jgi:cathepsin E
VTLVLVATNAFKLYQNATGGVPDHNTGLLTITSDQFNALQDLSFTISGVCI